jgi:hypothetical protein
MMLQNYKYPFISQKTINPTTPVSSVPDTGTTHAKLFLCAAK